MFRFLDKRFHKHRRVEFQLECLAHAHLGMSENHDSYNIRRKLLQKGPVWRELSKTTLKQSIHISSAFTSPLQVRMSISSHFKAS